MTHSIVTLNDSSFISKDIDLAATILLMKLVYLDVIEELPTENRGLLNFFASWEDSIEYDGAGCINIDLDSLIESNISKEALLSVLDNSLKKLSEFEEKVPGDYINPASEIVTIKFDDLSTSRFRKVLLEFRELVLKEN